jgi:hypothetical protein
MCTKALGSGASMLASPGTSATRRTTRQSCKRRARSTCAPPRANSSRRRPSQPPAHAPPQAPRQARSLGVKRPPAARLPTAGMLPWSQTSSGWLSLSAVAQQVSGCSCWALCVSVCLREHMKYVLRAGHITPDLSQAARLGALFKCSVSTEAPHKLCCDAWCVEMSTSTHARHVHSLQGTLDCMHLLQFSTTPYMVAACKHRDSATCTRHAKLQPQPQPKHPLMIAVSAAGHPQLRQLQHTDTGGRSFHGLLETMWNDPTC